MESLNVCKYMGSCHDCIIGGSLLVETMDGSFCCVDNLAVVDEPVVSIVENSSYCPEQEEFSFVTLIWVLLLLLLVIVFGIILLFWRKRQVSPTENAPSPRTLAEVLVPLLHMARMAQSADIFSSDATYDLPPPPQDTEQRTYVNTAV